MLLGYSLILIAAVFWGASGVFAKWLFLQGVATPLTISQTRVLIGWLFFFLWVIAKEPKSLRVGVRSLAELALLGVIGVAGANFGLYYAISRMDAALADLIQFTAPMMVALWVWLRREEPFSRQKLIALVLSTGGVALSLGVLDREVGISLVGALSAFGSALSYAFLMLWGKRLSRRYSQSVILHYAMLAASLFWFTVQSPARLWSVVDTPSTLGPVVALGICSVVVPYTCFFAGLRRVATSGAAIVSSLEPAVIALMAHIVLGETLSLFQIAGMVCVLAGIALVELDRAKLGAKSTSAF